MSTTFYTMPREPRKKERNTSIYNDNLHKERNLKKNTKLKVHDEYTNEKHTIMNNHKQQKYTMMRQTEHQCMLYKKN